jgi:RNA-directed DNA polymerase
VSPTLHDATAFHALRTAARNAARGHKQKPETAAFLCDLETEVLQLQRELRSGSYRPGPFQTFRIRDPKPRTISAAPFRDRVVHHALCAAMEPTFEARADPDSFACRVGKGNRAAVWRLQRLTRAWPWYAKLDVERYFETLPLSRLLGLLHTLFDDRPLLDAVEVVLRAGSEDGETGLPIGNLTSQHFANLYLGELDRFARASGVGGLVRYMDDVVVLGPDKASVAALAQAMAQQMEALGLGDKASARRLGPVHIGVPFLGFRVWPHRIRVDRAARQRLLQKLRRPPRGLSESEVQVRQTSLAAWAAHGDTRGLLATVASEPATE